MEGFTVVRENEGMAFAEKMDRARNHYVSEVSQHQSKGSHSMPSLYLELKLERVL